jgi:hypothetical protein
VALATGAEWRRESTRVNGDPYGNGIFGFAVPRRYPADPILNTTGNNWYAGNYHNAAGTYNVKEAYAELNLPVLKSATWGEANINIADRHTKYSTSGHAELEAGRQLEDRHRRPAPARGHLERRARAELERTVCAAVVVNNRRPVPGQHRHHPAAYRRQHRRCA